MGSNVMDTKIIRCFFLYFYLLIESLILALMPLGLMLFIYILFVSLQHSIDLN